MFTVARKGSRIAVEEAISLCRSLNSIGPFKFDQLSVDSKSEGNLRSGFAPNVQVRAKTSNRFLVVPYRHASIHR